MNKGGVIISLLIAGIILLFNKQLLFLIQTNFLKTHQKRSDAGIKKYGAGSQKAFYRHAPFPKAWAHRVDRLERFYYLQQNFDGFEIDVVFDSAADYFDVGHPPAPTIHLSFEKYLAVQGAGKKLFWMDLKNLDSNNVQQIRICLNRLDSIYHIRERVIVESNNIDQLVKISRDGYFTSYYYDELSYNELITRNKGKGTGSLLDSIDAVSQSDDYNTLFKRRFPSKPHLLWAISISNYFSHRVFNAYDNDTSILVYLVNIKSPYYR